MTKRINVVALVLVGVMLLFTCSASLAWGLSSEEQYENAISLLKENKYSEAAQEFIFLKGYADAPRYAMYCNAVVAAENGNFAVAVANLQSLNGFLDSSLLVDYYSARGHESLEMYEQAHELLRGISLYKDSAERLELYPDLTLQRDYRIADTNEISGKLDSAYSGFLALGNYKDSSDRANSVKGKINERNYAAAIALADKQAYEEAKSAFLSLGNYKDSAEQAEAMQGMINERDYQKATLLEEKGEYAAAYDAFIVLGNYEDSATRAASVRQRAEYAKGLAAVKDGRYKAAFDIFTALGDYEDSKSKSYILGITNFASLKTIEEGVATFEFHGNIGLVNLNENITTPPQWSEIGSFNDGLAWAVKGGLYGVVDTKGNVVSDYMWKEISNFNKGFCIVAAENSNRKTHSDPSYLLVLMDKQGNIVNENGWKTIGNAEYSKYLSLNKPVFKDGLISISNQNGYGFMNQNGIVVIAAQFDKVKEFSNGLVAVCKNDKWGFLDTTGTVIIPLKFREVTSFTDSGLADVNLNGEWQIINKEGQLIYFK